MIVGELAMPKDKFKELNDLRELEERTRDIFNLVKFQVQLKIVSIPQRQNGENDQII